MPLTEQEIETYHRDDYTLAQVINGGQVDLNLARDIVLKAGQISLHEDNLVHGSDANRSNKRRMGLVLRIMPATSFYNHNSGTFSKLGLDLLRENAAFEPWREACQLLQKQLAASD